MSDTLVKVEGVSKKFCRSFKRSLWYGLRDLGDELVGRSHASEGALRPDEFWAVGDIGFELERGQCLGLIGRNGAGKTTLLRMLNGLIKPDRGRIEMRGRVGALIALGAGFNPILTGRENIYVNGSVLGLRKREIDDKLDDIIEFSELGEFIDSAVQTYSAGMQVRLGFAVATALEPSILLLDEVLAVGDHAFRTKCFNRIQDIVSRCAVIFVSHSMSQITRLCDQVLLLDHGRCVEHSHDLGGVIARYHALNQSPSPSAGETQEEGSGAARIGSVLVHDAQQTPCLELVAGEPFGISLELALGPAARAREPRLLITIAGEDGANVAQIQEPLPAEAEFSVQLDFDAMPLNAGRYSITANVLLGARGELAHVSREIQSFTVRNSYVGYAPVILRPSRYSMLPSPRSDEEKPDERAP